MSGIIDWVDSSVLCGIDSTFSATFSSEKDSSLQLKRLRDREELNGDADVTPHLWSTHISSAEELQESSASRISSQRNRRFANLFKNCHDPCQIFCVRQKHSYARLYITREVFDHLLEAYQVFDRIWDFVLPFSFKTRESDLVNAPFRFRQLEPGRLPHLGSFGR